MKVNWTNLLMLCGAALVASFVIKTIIPDLYILRIILMMTLGFFWPYPILEERG